MATHFEIKSAWRGLSGDSRGIRGQAGSSGLVAGGSEGKQISSWVRGIGGQAMSVGVVRRIWGHWGLWGGVRVKWGP